MTKDTLEQMYKQHRGKVSLKWSSYLTEYNRIFNEYRNRNVSILELGVQNGGSLEIWANYFPKAHKLVGCDIDSNCSLLRYDDPRITVVFGDANTDKTQAEILKHSPIFDLTIDDASHRSSDIIKSFNRYFPRLANDGIYIVEDLHCSYWQEFEGGLYDPFSAITFFKRLADTINYEHWGLKKGRADLFLGFCTKYDFKLDDKALEDIHSIEFVNSMCIIRKGRNSLGNLFVTGTEEIVSAGHLNMNLRAPMLLDQTDNEWTARATPPDEELLLRIQDLFERDIQVATLTQEALVRDNQVATLTQEALVRDNQVKELINSKCWRITKPLRYIGNIFRKNIL